MRHLFTLGYTTAIMFLLVAGCGKSDKSKDDSKQSSTLTDPKTDPQNQDNVSPVQLTDLVQDQDLAAELGKLTQQANEFESQMKFDEAIDVWNKIASIVSQQFGDASWQMTNVRLAIKTAKAQQGFSAEQKRVLRSIEQLQQTVAKAIREKDYGIAYENSLMVMRLTQNLFGNQSHLYGQMQSQLARICLYNSQPDLAIDYFSSSLSVLKAAMGDVHPEVESTVFSIGQIYQQTGQFEKAIPYLEESLDLAHKVWGDAELTYAMRCHDLGVAYHRARKIDEAVKLLETARAIRQQKLGSKHPQLGHTLRNLAVVYQDRLEYGKSKELYQQAATIFANLLGPDNSFTVDCRIKLAVILTLLKEYPAAEVVLNQVARSQKNAHGENNRYYAQTLFRLASVMSYQAKYKAAEPLFQTALQLQKKHLGDRNTETQKTMEAFAMLLERTNRLAEANQMRSGLRTAAFEENRK